MTLAMTVDRLLRRLVTAGAILLALSTATAWANPIGGGGALPGNSHAPGCVHAAGGKRKQMARVQDNRAEQEFELTVDGVTAIAAYQIEGDTIVFTHTQVPERIAGHGVGSRLIRGALDQVRDRGLRVIAQCPFVADYIRRHPEYRDLLR